MIVLLDVFVYVFLCRFFPFFFRCCCSAVVAAVVLLLLLLLLLLRLLLLGFVVIQLENELPYGSV